MIPGARTAFAFVVVAALTACATPGGEEGALPDIEPGTRPAADTDEAGLWYVMDKVEANLKTSGRIVHDPALNAYVREVLCRVAPEICDDIRIYIVRTPNFNASMAPNGVMQVWTGLILRSRNEAQLAYIIGHETAHYLRRHSVQRWRNIRSTSNGMVFVQLLTAMAGVGFVGDIAQLVALGGIYGFSRDNEREADGIGFELLTRASYDLHEAGKVWEALIEEKEAAESEDQLIFFATHPASEERMATLKELADAATMDGARGDIGRDRFLAETLRFRTGFIRDELRVRDYDRTQVVLDHLFEDGENPGELHYMQGELYRLRGDEDEGDDENALAAYARAIATGTAPPETFRSQGTVLQRTGDAPGASAAFKRYLAAKPDANDRRMIEAYITQLQ